MDRRLPSIRTIFFRNMMIVAIASGSLLFFLWMQNEYRAFLVDAESFRRSFDESQKEMLREEVKKVMEYVNYRKDQTGETLKTTIRNRVEEACKVAMNIHQVNSSGKTPGEIQKMIKDALRELRFNDGRGYYFIFNLSGIEELFADRPELEGVNMLPVQGAKGEFVVRDMLELVKARGEGFYDYTWTKPGEKDNFFQKIAYVKLLPVYDWVIGTGEYVDDVRDDIKKEVLARLVTMKFGKEGYFFGSIMGGQPLFTNGKITKGTGSVWDLVDPNGVKITQESHRVAQHPEGGFVRYSWQKLNGTTPSPKISFVMGIPEWQWIIGAGVYLDTVEEEIAQKKALLFSRFKLKAASSSAVLCIILLIIFFWAKRMAGNVQYGLDTFIHFCKKAATESVTIPPDALKFAEFREIAESTNSMLESRREGEEALVASEEKYRTLFHHMVQGVYYQLADGSLTDVNEAALDIFGVSRERFLEQTSSHPQWQIVGEDGYPLPEGEHPAMLALRTGKPVLSSVLGVWNVDQEVSRWMNVNAIPQFRPGEAQPYQVFVTLQDFTERRKVLLALRESEAQFRTLTVLAPVGIYLSSPEGSCQYVNPRWCEMAGLTSAEAMNDGWMAAIHPDDRGRVLAGWQRMVASEGRWGPEYRFRRKDGEITWVQGLATPQHDEMGRIIRYIGINIDITERKTGEAERTRLEGQLQQAQRLEAIGTLAGGIAHDFNNILGAILGYAEMARDDCPSGSSIAGDLDEILKAGNRAKELVKQILAFSRQASAERVSMLPSTVIKEGIKLLRPSLPSTIAIQLDIDETAGPILADPTQVHQIIVNLCTNAYHAMETTGGVLTIGLQTVEISPSELGKEPKVQPGSFVRLSVSDTGYGITPEILVRIFDPYFTTKEIGKGTGMGLAIVHGIAKSYEGFVTCTSALEKGTTIEVFLPVVTRATGEEEQQVEELASGSERILFIDDEKILGDMAKLMLERLGYRVTVRNSSLEAITTFLNQPREFDVVITDQTMPGMTGLDMARRMLQIRPDLPVILCTGYSSLVSEEKARAFGIKEFAMKPLAKRDIARLLRKVLDGGKPPDALA